MCVHVGSKTCHCCVLVVTNTDHVPVLCSLCNLCANVVVIFLGMKWNESPSYNWVTGTQYKTALRLVRTERTYSWSGTAVASPGKAQDRHIQRCNFRLLLLFHPHSWHIGTHTCPCILNKKCSAKISFRNVWWWEMELLWSSMKQSNFHLSCNSLYVNAAGNETDKTKDSLLCLSSACLIAFGCRDVISGKRNF